MSPPPASASRERLAVIVRNRAARRALAPGWLEAAVRAATPAGWRVAVRDPASREEARQAVVDAVREGAAAILANGGDGTLNLVVDALAGSGTDTAVGFLPSGTANVWAHEAGIPHDPGAALALLATGHRARADLGVLRVGEDRPRRFLLMCSAGIDAHVVQEVEQHAAHKRRFGRAAFVPPAVGALAAAAPVEAVIEIHGSGEPSHQRVVLYQLLAANSRLYGGIARPAGRALMDDGALDLLVVEAADTPPGRLRALGRTARALLGASADDEGLQYRRAERIVVRPDGELPVQVDGEFAGVATPGAPLTLQVEPRAITLIVTRRARRLFLQW